MPTPRIAHQQHALGGAEVAAVHAGAEHGRPDPPGASTGSREVAPGPSCRASTQRGDPRLEDHQQDARARPAPARSPRTRRPAAPAAARRRARRRASDATPIRSTRDALARQLAPVADHAGHRARHQPDGVGDVGGHRRYAEREQGRERDQRPRPHHGVDGARGQPGQADGDGFEQRHPVRLRGGRRRGCRRRRVVRRRAVPAERAAPDRRPPGWRPGRPRRSRPARPRSPC